jgi:GNAT superfamily N-acetyltransferase
MASAPDVVQFFAVADVAAVLPQIIVAALKTNYEADIFTQIGQTLSAPATMTASVCAMHMAVLRSTWYLATRTSDGTVVGFACMCPVSGAVRRSALRWLCVIPEMQRRGIGSHLLSTVIDRAVLCGHVAVVIDVPSDKQTWAFLATRGFTLPSMDWICDRGPHFPLINIRALWHLALGAGFSLVPKSTSDKSLASLREYVEMEQQFIRYDARIAEVTPLLTNPQFSAQYIVDHFPEFMQLVGERWFLRMQILLLPIDTTVLLPRSGAPA